ncbi:hypothetical protein DFH11DRAFT_1613421 [Phellopilus nigrolimitatus]|nr:hypothetical protein DFH11DRAFT_1613421 [Phellopilus nigrolimitatus]
MALVATHDWPNDMDNRQQRPHINTVNSPVHSDPANPSAAAAAAAAVQQTQGPYSAQPYNYGHQQQPPWNVGSMNMGMNMNMGQPGYFPPQMQYYPQHYPHAQQPPPPPMHGQHQQGSPYGQPPQMFDPNAQFAQWAYQQMMFNAQQSQAAPHRSRSNAGTPTNEYYQAPFSHSRFQSGTPPPPPPPQNTSGSYQGFHPYRRPERGDRRPHADNQASASSSSTNVPFQPPYARSDAAGSTTSVNSTSSQRSRTNSGGSVRPHVSPHQHTSQHIPQHTPRTPSTSSTSSTPRSAASSSSTASVSTLSTPTSTTPASRTSRPSPLSQGAILSAAERRKSRDDSDLAAMMSSTSLGGLESTSSPSAQMARSGLKGRLRRALSFNAVQTLREEEEEAAAKSNGKKKEKDGEGETEGEGDGVSMATKKTKKSLRMFNSRFNASTDNISLSSTVSSASVMIRKLGSMGRLARRNSLAGITSLFKDKDKEKDGESTDTKGKKSKGKASKSEASVSHVTAELERTNDWSGPGMEGLSPAAKLARQHTLKSNAEAAARAKAQHEAQAAASAASSGTAVGANGAPLPTTWEHSTVTTRQGSATGGVREDGMRVVVEEDESDEEMGRGVRRSEELEHGSGSDEDSTWHGHGRDEDDEDVTIRIGADRDHVDGEEGHEEPWAVNVRRSGILKNANSYAQDVYLDGPNPAFAQRVRANSYDSVPNHQQEAGPLARMPSPDPDHIDGLHRHGSHRSSGSSTLKDSAAVGPPLLPPLSFDSPQSIISSLPSASSLTASDNGSARQSMFNHPGLNSSEPTLSTMVVSPPTLTHRSATTPSKRLAFATNLNIYDTFSPSAYDRRSEPATWSRLTPALAQRIKEELNSYKMEEMEVHSASRVQYVFFLC